jgi:DNA polymerase III epsilon subunit-like protein
MRILVLDTETNGLPKTKILTKEMLNKWPHIVQLSFIVFNDTTQIIEYVLDNIIRLPKNVQISYENSVIHGITEEISQKKGINIVSALQNFIWHLDAVDLIVCHNTSFDLNIIYAELLRLDSQFSDIYIKKIKEKKTYCTMEHGTPLCNIIKKFKNSEDTYIKFPKLSELHQHLFQCIPDNLHNSLIDIFACLRCYYKIEFNYDLVKENIGNYNEMILYYKMVYK